LDHLEASDLSLATLDPTQLARFENYPSEQVRTAVKKLRGQRISQDRQQVFDDYREEALSTGNAENGKRVFEKNCASCHDLGGSGEALGPSLASMISRGTESVLFNILAPNGEVGPQYLEYVVMTVDGQVLSGLVASETTTAITLRSGDNKTTTVLRVDIDQMQNTGKSLMPEGFEKAIDKQAMSDLLTYLQAATAEGAAK
jgi:putative heme-binding domain-containing protein